MTLYTEPDGTWQKPTQNNLITTLDMPANYAVSFELKLLGTIANWGSLVLVTAYDDNRATSYGRRIPALFTHRNSTSVSVVTGTKADGNLNWSSPNLPLNEVRKIDIVAYGTEVRIYLDGERVHSWTDHHREAHAGAKLYMGDPWHPGAKAEIRNLSIVEATGFPAETSGPLTGETAWAELDVDFYRPGSVGKEYVRLRNETAQPIELQGLRLKVPTAQRLVRDAGTNVYEFKTSSILLPQSEVVVRAAGSEPAFGAERPLFYSNAKDGLTDTVELISGAKAIKSVSKTFADKDTLPEP